MLAVRPGEVVQHLHNLVVEEERGVAVVAEVAQAEVEPRYRWNTPALRVRRKRKPQLLDDVALPSQLLRAVVDKRSVPKAELVHLGGRQDPGIGEHILLGIGVERDSAQRKPWLYRELIGPTEASEPLRSRAFLEIDTLVELALIDCGFFLAL